MMPTALVGGAARRTAAQADGVQACMGTARKGTARMCNDVRVLQGHSRGTHATCRAPATLARARAAARVRRGRHRTARAPWQCGGRPEYVLRSISQMGTLQYSRGTPRGTPSSSGSAFCRAGCIDGAAAGTAAQFGRHRSFVGLLWRYWVLTGYSRGTHGVPKEYCISRTHVP
jgi:hypothetical protein